MKIFNPTHLDKIMHISKEGKIYQLDSFWKMLEIATTLKVRYSIEDVDDNLDPDLFKVFHTTAFAEALLLGKNRETLIESCGVFWQPYLPIAMFNRAHAVIKGVQNLIAGDSLSIVIADGGHHTTPEKAYGFGPINAIGTALYQCSRALSYKKVVILDLDVHQGNGFSFIDKSNTGIFDIWSKRLDKWEVNSSNQKYEEFFVKDAAEWRSCFENVLTAIKSLAPDILVYYSGVDVLSSDRMGGIQGFTLDLLQYREDTLFEFCRKLGIKVLLTIGGGYVNYSDKNAVAEERKHLVATHMYTIESAIKHLG